MRRWQSTLLGRPEDVEQIVCNILAPLLQLAVLIWVIVAYPGLPEKVPSHFGAAGAVTSYAGKGTVWVMPILGMVFDPILWMVQFFPQTWNTGVRTGPEEAPRVLHFAHDLLTEMRLGMSLLFALGAAMMILQVSRAAWYLPAVLIVCFAPLVRYMIRIVLMRRGH